MSDLIITNIDGQAVYIEVQKSYGSEETSSADEVLLRAKTAFEQAKTTIAAVAKSLVSEIHKLDRAVTPNEFVIEFAIKFSAEGQVILAKIGTEANLKITMTYKHDKAE